MNIDEYDSTDGALKNLEDVRCHSQFIQQAARWIILYHIIRILFEYIKNLLSYHHIDFERKSQTMSVFSSKPQFRVEVFRICRCQSEWYFRWPCQADK